jgi:hypothetical protein
MKLVILRIVTSKLGRFVDDNHSKSKYVRYKIEVTPF